ncbi:hypothetical protein HPB49_024112 [Dermacentor silvarum]|uniref:Uncharacterized protein n=1 Tax=Dermacentor silvarum TaxID=543639 RepID=A0ACB8E493_DERSI|nr:hypothetical protein HPB49_024112 [Dermacentor silvarum]
MEQQTWRQGKRPRPRNADKHVCDRHWKSGFAEDALQCGSDSDQEIEITCQTRTENDPAQAKKATETANLYPNEVLQDTTTIIVRPKTAASILSIPDTVLNAWLKERLRSETPATIRKQLRANVIAVDIPADVETQPFLKIEKLGPVPVQAYVTPPRDAIKGVIYGVSTEFTDEDIRATFRPLQGLVTRRTFAHMKHDVADAEEHILQAKSAPLRNHAVYIAKVNMLWAIPAAHTTNANY